jgi:hypothetical protein
VVPGGQTLSQLSLSDVFSWRPPEGVVLLVSSHHDGPREQGYGYYDEPPS